MRIGIMLRDIGNQLDAPGIIVSNLTEKLLELDREHEYVLFLSSEHDLGWLSDSPNAKIVVVKAPNRFLWDQVAIPLVARRERIDLLFHPKHSLPLLTGCKTLMHLRGDEHRLAPGSFDWSDVLYQRLFRPLFCKKATHIIAESDSVKQSHQENLNIPDHKITRIYLAPGDLFHAHPQDSDLAACRAKFGLPDEYIFTVTRVIQGKRVCHQKNIVRILEAYRQSKTRQRSKFVIVGRQTKAFIDAHLEPGDDLRGDLVVLDAVPQQDLPPLYAMAKAFVFPSLYESFGMPIVEAMACGCPVVTSTTYACKEIGGEAALLVDPESTTEIRDAIDRLTHEPALCAALAAKGRDHAANFTWRNAALETLAIIDQLEAGIAGAERTPRTDPAEVDT